MEKLIIFVILALIAILVVLIIRDEKEYKLQRQWIFRNGAVLVYYACKNKDFDDYNEIGRCEIVDIRNKTVKLEWSDGNVSYYSISQLGVYDDKLEVYHGETKVATFKFE